MEYAGDFEQAKGQQRAREERYGVEECEEERHTVSCSAHPSIVRGDFFSITVSFSITLLLPHLFFSLSCRS